MEMLASLQKMTYPNYEVIIVDNASPNEDPEAIKKAFPDITLVISKTNLGFAGGNNLGLLHARGKYILFLNNDTEVTPGFLEPMVSHFENHPEAGMASPKILFWNSPGKKHIQYTGAGNINPYTIRGKSTDYQEVDHGQHDVTRETDRAHGAAMMVPASVIEETGLMSDIFFLYYEEHDWCERVKRAGYKVYFIGKSTVYHKESMSVGVKTPLKTYYMNRARIIYARRNVKGFKRLIAFLFLVGITLPKNTLVYLKNREIGHLKAFWAAFKWNFQHANVKKNPAIKTDANGKKYLVNTDGQTLRKFDTRASDSPIRSKPFWRMRRKSKVLEK